MNKSKLRDDLGGLGKIVGNENISNDECELVAYGIDADLLVEVKPIAVVRPGNVEEVSKLVKFANQKEIPITCWGGGTSVVGAHTPEKAILLDMTRMNKVVEIDEGSLTVTTQAGITWGQLMFELEEKGWTTGPFLHSGLAASVGGSVVLCGNAITAAKYGLVGNQVVGLQVVLPNGKILRTGSGANPSTKNFYRYAWASDLTGLFIGSHGIFGIITEVTLKLYPLPQEKGFSGYVFGSLDSTTKALYEIQKQRISINAAYFKLGINDPSYKPEEAVLSPIAVEGTKKEVKNNLERIKKICKTNGGSEVPSNKLAEDKEVLRMMQFNTPYVFGNEGPPHPRKMVNMHPCCSCARTVDIPKLYQEVKKFVDVFELERYGIDVVFQGWACENCVICSPLVYFDPKDQEIKKKVQELLPKLFGRLVDAGHTPHYLGQIRAPAVMPKLGEYNELMKFLKKTMDPKNILNPSVLF